jgi:chromosome segregation ATPase
MDPVSLAATVGIIAGALIALGVILKTLINVYKFFRGLDDAGKIIREFPEWQAKVNAAMKELHPNHGSSLKDQITEIDRKLNEQQMRILEVADSIVTTNQKIEDTNIRFDSLDTTVDTLGNSLEEIRQLLQSHVDDDQIHSR